MKKELFWAQNSKVNYEIMWILKLAGLGGHNYPPTARHQSKGNVWWLTSHAKLLGHGTETGFHRSLGDPFASLITSSTRKSNCTRLAVSFLRRLWQEYNHRFFPTSLKSVHLTSSSAFFCRSRLTLQTLFKFV